MRGYNRGVTLDAWIIPSKLSPPALPPDILPREDLCATAREPAVTILQAGPGGGKTLTMALLAQRIGGELAWVSLDQDDCDPTTLFAYLVAAIRAHVPPFGDEVRAMAGQGAPAKAVWSRLFQSLGAYDPPALTIALDDVHGLIQQTPEVISGLTYFLDKLPRGVRLLLSTRKRYPGALGRLSAAGTVRVIDEARLRFNPAEVDAYMRARVPGLADDPAFRERAHALEGWPLGLDLLTADPGRAIALGGSGGSDPEIEAYIAEELYQGQPALRRSFMLRAAILEEPTAEACREVLQLADTDTTLAALEADHLVTRRGEAYVFPNHLRQFLRTEAERVVPAEERRGWHRWAAEHYREQGRDELAIPHLIACGDWRAAGQACRESFPRMRHDGRLALIGRWLDAFPEAAFDQDPYLLVWHGSALARDGRLPEGLAAFDRALTSFTAREDRAGQFKVRVRQANIALARQEARDYANYLLAAQALATDGEPEDLADLALIRGHAAEQKGDLEGFRNFNEQVLAQRDDGGLELAASRYIAHVNLYTYQLHRGAYREAHGHLERAIAIADERNFYPYMLAAKLQRIHLWACEGKVDEAESALKALPAGWREVLDWHDLACAHAVAGNIAMLRGQWREADDRLKASLNLFDRIGLQEGKKIPLELQLWVCVRRHTPQRMSALLAEANVPAGKTIYDLALLLPRARAALQLDDAAGALALAGEAVTGLTPLNAARHLAHAHAIIAAARLRLGERGAARAAFEQAEQLLQSRQIAFLRNMDAELWNELSTLGAAAPVASAAAAVAQQVRTAPSLAETEQQAGGTAPLGLTLRMLGGFEARVDGSAIDRWPRQSAKLILASLAIYPRGLTLVELAEHVGGGEASNLTRFKVAVSTLRRILEPEVEHGRESRFVQFADERYLLAPDALASVDVRAFENGLTTAERLWAEDPNAAAGRLAETLALYRGNLLDCAPFNDRFLPEREALRFKALQGFLRLAAWQKASPNAAEQTLTRLLGLMPWEEEAALALMRHHAAIDRPDRVRQVYWDCRKALKAAFGGTPSEEFEQAYQALLKA
ncbi:MAG: BTAD domain-containing putative transcriptional regulator [Candidatus Sericytochromatia bacterium]|nr:BTAD domain-containing putative transcriptional regulator [Candidatus Sericytochromatia bacterium]